MEVKKLAWLLLIVAVGCSKPAADAVKPDAAAGGESHEGHSHEGEGEEGHSHDDHADAGHSHDGWWCPEHGVPEEVCALCSSKVAADFKAKGDWCKAHDRPESQCFICHPEKEAEFAAQYEAKFGEKPPKPEA